MYNVAFFFNVTYKRAVKDGDCGEKIDKKDCIKMKLSVLMGRRRHWQRCFYNTLHNKLWSFARSIVLVHACSLCRGFICIRSGVRRVGVAVGKIAVSPPAPTQTPTLQRRLMYGNDLVGKWATGTLGPRQGLSCDTLSAEVKAIIGI